MASSSQSHVFRGDKYMSVKLTPMCKEKLHHLLTESNDASKQEHPDYIKTDSADDNLFSRMAVVAKTKELFPFISEGTVNALHVKLEPFSDRKRKAPSSRRSNAQPPNKRSMAKKTLAPKTLVKTWKNVLEKSSVTPE